MQSAGRDELLVIMPPDERMMRDLLMYERTNKYIRQNFSTTQQESIKRILTDKTLQNQERYNDLKQHIVILLGKSKMFINANLVDIGGTDPQGRIIKGFHDLIIRTYPNLKMLKDFPYTESYVVKCLKDGGNIFGDDISLLSEAEQEMLSFVKANKANGIRTTGKNLIEWFEKKSYGWYYAAILCILAKLCAAGKVELNADSNILEEDLLEKALLNTHGHANLIIEPLNNFTAGQIKSLKQFYEDFFDTPISATEAKALGKETTAAIKKKIEALSKLAGDKGKYPFLAELDKIIETLNELKGKPYTFFLTDLHKIEDSLLDLKENVLDPIQRFMNGPLKTIYEDAVRFSQRQEHNFSYIDGDESEQIHTILKDLTCYKGNKMQQVKSLVGTVSEKIDETLKQSKQISTDKINALLNKMMGMDDFKKLSDEKRQKLKIPFENLFKLVQDQTLIPVVTDMARRFEDDKYPILLSDMGAWNRQPSRGKDFGDASNTGDQDKDHKISENGTNTIEFVRMNQIQVEYGRAWLENEDDISQYLDSLRRSLHHQVKQGKKIQL